jgi:hypothetical protein
VRSIGGGAWRGGRAAVEDGPWWRRAGQRESGAVQRHVQAIGRRAETSGAMQRRVEPDRGGQVTGGPGHRMGDEQAEAVVKTIVAAACKSSKTNKCVRGMYSWARGEV